MKIGTKGIEKKDKTPTIFQKESGFESTGVSSLHWDDIEVLGKLGSGASANVKKIKNKN